MIPKLKTLQIDGVLGAISNLESANLQKIEICHSDSFEAATEILKLMECMGADRDRLVYNAYRMTTF